ncbi:MAG: Mur ligase family protein [Tissierellia bacterium]|nr:Mur ligase family protein [Tissierellia bacterium]
MKLKKLLNSIDYLDIKGDYNKFIDIKDICYHTDKIVENSIYVAIKGFKTDGHKYIKKAIENGAIIAVVEEFTNDECVQIKVPDSRKALADLSYRFFDEPSGELNIIGITASNGKTTTAFMTESIFNYNNIDTAICGTVELKYKDVFIPSVLTTPESRELQYHIRNMADKGVENLIMEVSSAGEYLNRVRNIEYDIVTFNNFTPEHLDMHKSAENYFAEKSRLITEAKPSAYAILNMDEPKIKSLKSKTCAKVIGYSFENENEDIFVKNIDLSTGFGRFELLINTPIEADDFIIEPQSLNVKLNVAGFSSIMNAVPAIMIGLFMGIDAEKVLRGIEQFKGVERRFEIIYDQDFKIIDDHYANRINVDVTLNTLSQMDYNELVILYALRGSRGVEVNRDIANETCKWMEKIRCKKLILTTSEDIVGEKDFVTEDELKVFKEELEKAGVSARIVKTLKEALDISLEAVKKGDVLLLGGAQGMDKAAGIILPKLAEGKSEEKKKEILKPLETRIC